MLGRGNPEQNPSWNQTAIDSANANQEEAFGYGQDAYNQALGLAQGGPSAAQGQMVQGQGMQNAALAQNLAGAGGGARGMAAAQGLGVGTLGAGVGMQAMGLQQQRARDMATGASAASGIANQNRQLQAMSANQQYQDAFNQSTLEQQRRQQRNEGLLDYLGMQQNDALSRQGYDINMQKNAADDAYARDQRNNQFAQQMAGAGFNALGAGATAYSNSQKPGGG